MTNKKLKILAPLFIIMILLNILLVINSFNKRSKYYLISYMSDDSVGSVPVEAKCLDLNYLKNELEHRIKKNITFLTINKLTKKEYKLIK